MSSHNTLFIWDFDNTVVLDNTDTVVFERLGPDVLSARREAARRGEPEKPWTRFIADGLRTLHARGLSADVIRAAAAEAPLPSDTADALRRIANAPHARSLVLSDANSIFIDACLQKARLPSRHVFQAGVYTNPAHIDRDGRVVLTPFIPEDDAGKAHGCAKCPRNMCKGEVLERLVEVDYRHWRLVYVGDGGNDYCPVTRMSESGAVLARSGFSLHKAVVRKPPKAQVQVWATAAELKQLVEEHL